MMPASSSLLGRLRTSPKAVVIAVAIGCIPMIYGATLIGANLDPTHQLDQIPAAVVNEDRAASVERDGGEPINLGETIAQELIDSSSSTNFDWIELSAEDAGDQLENGDVLAVLTIPSDFSANAVSVGNEDPSTATRAELSITTNDAANLIVGNIAESVGKAVADGVAANVSAEYLHNIYSGFTTISDGLEDAAGGAGQLRDGAAQAQDGSNELVVGLAELGDGSAALADGATQLADGAASADSGAQQLTEGARSTDVGAQQLRDGGAATHAGAQELAQGIARTDTGAQELSAGLQELETRIESLPAEMDRLATGAGAVADGAAEVATGASELDAAGQHLHAGASSLASGVDAALEGALALQAGTDELRSATPGLAAGTGSVADGLASLEANYEGLSDPQRHALIAQLADGAATAHGGAVAVDTAAEQIHTGARALAGDSDAQTGLSAVQNGANSVVAGTSALQAGTGTLAQGAADLHDGADNLADGLGTLGAGIGSLSTAISEASTGATSLASGTTALSAGSAALIEGTSSLAAGSSQLADGTSSLAAGAAQLREGTSSLGTGSQDLANGAHDLATGTEQASGGADALDNGIRSLAAGTDELATGLNDGLAAIPSYTDTTAEQLADVAASPVQLNADRLNAVPTHGYGLAPYFIALALWVGALGFYLMMPTVRERLLHTRQPAWVVAVRSLLPGTAMAFAQSLLLLLVLRSGLGIEAANGAGLALLVLLTSLTFFAINQALIALLDAPGRFLALLFIVVQLAAAGGTYPIQTAPSFFQAVHPWLPLTYAVQAFRTLISGGTLGLLPALGMLSAWLVGSLAVTTLAVVLRRRKQRTGPDAPQPASPADIESPRERVPAIREALG